MSLDSDRITTVTFDSYSTLVDVDAVANALADRVPDHMVESISKLWRSRSLAYTFVANEIDAYQPFYEMNRDALGYALVAHDVDLTEAERDEILAVYHALDVFSDVREGIERLNDGGYDCYVVSNGDPEMLASMVEHAGIDDLIQETISADEIQTFKPNVDLYRHAAARTGTPIEEIAHVSAGWFDILGAQYAGMGGVWVNRSGDEFDLFDGNPDLVIERLDELAEILNGDG